MKTLNQLKNRLAWEIQTHRDRINEIDETRGLRVGFGIGNDEVNQRLLSERAARLDRIEALEALDKGRRTRKALHRRLARVPAAMKRLVLDDLAKVNHATNQVRLSLGI